MAARSSWPPVYSVRLAMRSMTSPGMKRTDRNTNTLSMNRVGMTSSSRRMM